jgi:hypothetical protein
MIFWRKIVIFHTKYPKNVRASLRNWKKYDFFLKKLRRVEGGAKIFGVFRVKHHDFTPKNHIFSNCGGRREHFLGYFV